MPLSDSYFVAGTLHVAAGMPAVGMLVPGRSLVAGMPGPDMQESGTRLAVQGMGTD